MSDSVERLRLAADRVVRHCFKQPGDSGLMSIPADRERDVDLLLTEAADEIESLRSRLAEAESRQTCEGTQPYVCHALATARSRLADYELLKRAVNETGDCLPDCDSYAHNEQCPSVNNHVVLQDKQREIESLRKDAERYRWLVSQGDPIIWDYLGGMDDDQIDEAIDKWIADDAHLSREQP